WRDFFFFSSRRRHTRSYGDWSSDVCSSDLRPPWWCPPNRLARPTRGQDPGAKTPGSSFATVPSLDREADLEAGAVVFGGAYLHEIGRASCRERVEIAVVGGSVKRKDRRGIR